MNILFCSHFLCAIHNFTLWVLSALFFFLAEKFLVNQSLPSDVRKLWKPQVHFPPCTFWVFGWAQGHLRKSIDGDMEKSWQQKMDARPSLGSWLWTEAFALAAVVWQPHTRPWSWPREWFPGLVSDLPHHLEPSSDPWAMSGLRYHFWTPFWLSLPSHCHHYRLVW